MYVYGFVSCIFTPTKSSMRTSKIHLITIQSKKHIGKYFHRRRFAYIFDNVAAESVIAVSVASKSAAATCAVAHQWWWPSIVWYPQADSCRQQQLLRQ